MITDHNWNCDKKSCNFELFLRVDDLIPFDKIRLGKFETAVTNHVFINEHEVIHNQKEWKFNIK